MPQQRSTSLPAIYPHITTRDRRLLQLLDDHHVLTTDQIHRILFRARRTCQIRLNELRTLGLVERFRFAQAGGGSQPWQWTLGHNGHRFQAAAHQRPEPTARSSQQAVQRLSANPRLSHLITANEFFIRLTAHTRQHPEARLDRWWSETTATAQFRTITPDGHGLWSIGDHTTGFFLEADTGTEPLTKVVRKIDKYVQLGKRGGPRYPVLFWLASHEREEHLHTLLRQLRAPVPTATATQDGNPAEPVWLPSDRIHRVRIVDLPTDHGPAVADNPNYVDGIFTI